MKLNLSNYNAMLDYIDEHVPTHPELPRLKSKGLTLTSGILIQKIYNSILDSVQAAAVAAPVSKETDDAIIRSYNAQLDKLYTQRARFTNSFHISAGNHEDVQIAQSVIEVQQQIDAVMKDKAYYLERKELPPQQGQEEEFEIPQDPFELMRKIESVRTNMAHAKRKLRDCDPKKDPAKYANLEGNINRLTKHKMYLEQERNKNTQPAGV
jgi:hypothetical protein